MGIAIGPKADAYHYTDAQGLLGILSTGRLRLTDVQYLNDVQELSGVDAVAAALQDQAGGMLSSIDVGSPDTDLISDALRIESMARVFTDLARRRTPTARAFVACFCKRGDLLSQWRGYAAEGAGYAIGFNWSALSGLSVFRPEPPESSLLAGLAGKTLRRQSATWHIAQADVQYEGEAQLQGRAEAILDRFLSDRAADSVSVVRELAAVKNPAFEEEDERRIIAVFPDSEVPDLQFRSSRFGVVPYVEVALPEKAIREVVIGPSLPREAENALTDALRAYLGPQAAGVEVTRSSAPYR